MSLELAKGCQVSTPSLGVVVHHLIPKEAGLGFEVGIFSVQQAVYSAKYPLHAGMSIILEGNIKYNINDQDVEFGPSSFFSLSNSSAKDFAMQSDVRGMSIFVPDQTMVLKYFHPDDGFCVPKPTDRAYIDSKTRLPDQVKEGMDKLPTVPEVIYTNKVVNGGITVYNLASFEKAWSCSIIDLDRGGAPNHYHNFEDEHFFVLGGKVEVILDEKETMVLEAGQSIHIPPIIHHQLRSTAEGEMCRVLCFNFPTFNPDDFHVVETLGATEE